MVNRSKCLFVKYEVNNCLTACYNGIIIIVSYQVSKPSTEDRSLFFDSLMEAAMSVVLERVTKKSQESVSVPELPKAPKVASGPKASELKAKVEAEQHALRRLRMCLRDVCNR